MVLYLQGLFFMEKCSLYIIYSERLDIYYIGISHNPEQRLVDQNSFKKGFTVRERHWQLVYKKEFPNKKTALFWERKLKSFKDSSIIEKVINNQFDWTK